MIDIDPLYLWELETSADGIVDYLSDLSDGLDGIELTLAKEAMNRVDRAYDLMMEARAMLRELRKKAQG